MKNMEQQSVCGLVFSVVDKTIPDHPICLLSIEDLLGRLGYLKSCPLDLAEFSALPGETIAWLVSDYLLCIQNKLTATPTVRLGIEQFSPAYLYGTKDVLDSTSNSGPTSEITALATVISHGPSTNTQTSLEVTILSSQRVETNKTDSRCDLESSAVTPDMTSDNQALELSDIESSQVALIEDSLVENLTESLSSSKSIQLECLSSPQPVSIVKNVQMSDDDDGGDENDDDDDDGGDENDDDDDDGGDENDDDDDDENADDDDDDILPQITNSRDVQDLNKCRQKSNEKQSSSTNKNSNSSKGIFTDEADTDIGNSSSCKPNKCSKNREVKCFACEVVYANRSTLLDHIKKTHMVAAPMACASCGEVIGTAALFHQHQLTHFVENCTEKLFVCKFFCNVFRTEKDLIIHESTHVQEKRHSCTHCSKIFHYRYQLKDHYRVHTLEKPCVCKICDKAFRTQSNLRGHMLSHTQDKPYTCGLCNKTFKCKKSLPLHERLHTGETPYECKICGKPFKSGIALRQHGLFHTQERPHVCKVCNKRFKSKSTLNNHERLHTGEKPFVCEVCGKAFNRREILDSHVGIHNSGKLFKCKTCGKAFQCSATMRKHQLIHKSTKSYLCETCGMAFRFRQGLRQHEETHTGVRFPCEKCGKEYSRVWKLKSHTCLNGLKESWLCHMCGKALSCKATLRKHLKIHSKEKTS